MQLKTAHNQSLIQNNIKITSTATCFSLTWPASGNCSVFENRRNTLDFFIISGVRLSPLGTAATTGPLYQHQMIDDGDCGATGGMKIGR
jgi:hypothetical protein